MTSASDHPLRDAGPPSPSRDERLAVLQGDIAHRLRSLCAAMPQAEFDALVRQMAERQLKYELHDHR